jgi:hypothetical protein
VKTSKNGVHITHGQPNHIEGIIICMLISKLPVNDCTTCAVLLMVMGHAVNKLYIKIKKIHT